MPTLLKLLLMTVLLGTLATPVTAADKPATAGQPAAVAAAPAKSAPLDINSATEAQLKALPGIGDVYAKKIIAGRPYARKDQLQSRNILPGATYEKIQDLIIARQQ